MPTRPTITTLNATTPQILNAVANDLGSTYSEAVPYADGSIENLRAIGEAINSYQPRQNAFLSALINRIGRVIITSKMYSNPWAMFKKGMLEYGETIEEIFVAIAKPHQYNPAVAEAEVFKREIPDVKSAFHTMNYQKFYKVTIQDADLKLAFLSYDGVTDLIGRIIDQLYSAANYDEFLTMKYLIAKSALNGNIYPVNIPAATAANAKEITATMKGISNSLTFMSSDYNAANVLTTSSKSEQVLIMSAKFDAVMDVEVLAAAFNLPYVDFLNQRVLIDSFGTMDNARLAELFAEDPTYVPLTEEELAQLDTIPAFLCDSDWFMIFDNYFNMTEQYNGQGLYYNYWYHVWKTFSTSPYSNAILFTTETPAITSVTVTPASATVAKGSSLQLSASVVATGFAKTGVMWELSGDGIASTIDQNGKLTVGADETATSLTVTATSLTDGTKSGTATITVG